MAPRNLKLCSESPERTSGVNKSSVNLKKKECDNMTDIKSYTKRVGIVIRHYRRALGMTQVNLASAAGVKQAALSNIESGKSCYVPTLIKIADQLQIPVHTIFKRADENSIDCSKLNPFRLQSDLQKFSDQYKSNSISSK